MAAPRKLAGKTVVLSYNDGTEEAPVWRPFACSTANGFSGSTDTINTASKCDEGNFVENEAGDQSWEFSQSAWGIRPEDLEDGQASYQDAFRLWKSAEKRQFRMASEDETYIRQGFGIITDLSDSADNGDHLTFDITITGSGAVYSEEDLIEAV